jgi:ATP-binding cassette subfamily F protein 3
MPLQGGERELGHNVKLGYYSQWRVEMLDVNRTVFEEGMDTPQRVTEQFVRTALGSFLFRGDDVFKKVGVLSGGEKSRLALVKLLLDPPNLLLMDEPTTHLDMSSIDALIGALEEFQGTVIFISHDVYFIEKLSNHVVRVEGGKLTHYSGGYQYYLEKSAADAARNAPLIPVKAAPERLTGDQRREQKRLEAEQRQARSRERKERGAAVTKIEKEIATLEARHKEIAVELENPATYEKAGAVADLNREWKGIEDDLKRLATEWETAAAQVAALDAAG